MRNSSAGGQGNWKKTESQGYLWDDIPALNGRMDAGDVRIKRGPK